MATATPITIYGADWCGDCRRAKSVLEANSVDYEYVDLEVVPTAADWAKAISGRTNIPVITFPDGTHQVEPSNAALMAKLRQVGALG